jgi:excisionase family DNA binding protein
MHRKMSDCTREILAKQIALKQVPKVYGVAYSTCRQWIREGRLKAYRAKGGRQVYVRVADIEAMFVQVGGEDSAS